MAKRVIVTGGAGFIGSNLCDLLLKENCEITCIDNFDQYYNPKIKRKNIHSALQNKRYKLIEANLVDISYISSNLSGKYDAIIHLAVRAGLRYSIMDPFDGKEKNLLCLQKALELSLIHEIPYFIFASSSSIYGNTDIPFKEDYCNLEPLCSYASTKLISEDIGKEYSKKHGTTFISLRLFSAYGPRSRPDLVLYKIAHSLYFNESFKVFGDGNSLRDYTHVYDVVNGIIKALDYKASKFEIFNIGNSAPVKLSSLLAIAESVCNKKINVEYLKPIKGEAEVTWADISKAKKYLGYQPQVNIIDGVKDYINWFSKNYILN